ncbi:hypothetical protein [Chryseobacterium lactis]|nr:hypothetical protein [Chryseobacterium lactis]
MEGKQKFNYEATEKDENKSETDVQEIMSKILQVIIGLIMAILHM